MKTVKDGKFTAEFLAWLQLDTERWLAEQEAREDREDDYEDEDLWEEPLDFEEYYLAHRAGLLGE